MLRQQGNAIALAPELGRVRPQGLPRQLGERLAHGFVLARGQALGSSQNVIVDWPLTDDREIPRKQRRSDKPLQDWLALSASREEGLYRAHTEVWHHDDERRGNPRTLGFAGQSVDRSV